MNKLKALLYKAIARITGDNTILWDNRLLGADEQFVKPVKDNIFARRYPVCVVHDPTTDEYQIFVYDLDNIGVTINTTKDQQTIDDILEELSCNSRTVLEEFARQGLPLPEPSTYEQMQSYIEKGTVNKLIDIYTIGVLVVTN